MPSRAFIIAEAGVNHNGSLARALKMVDAAAAAGADAVKFQTFRAEALAARHAPKADYQRSRGRESQLDMLRRLGLSPRAHRNLLRRCRAKGIRFISSPFDIESVRLLGKLGIPVIKVPSGEITNLPYLRAVGALGRRVILSTGMSTLAEVKAAVSILVMSGTRRKDLCVLHCHTEYPTAYRDANLLAIPLLRKALGVAAGYSDHTPGIAAAVAAAALGASIIEKHFTLDKRLPGPDHKASLEPAELAALVRSVRNAEEALGRPVKRPTARELRNRVAARKSIVAARDIRKGDILCADNLTVKRPGTGISPMRWDKVVGRKATRDFQADDLIVL